MLNFLGAVAANAGKAPPVWMQIAPWLAMGLIFWFLILRPQMKQQKAHRDKITAMKKGDKVVTAGGLIGKITKVDDDYVDIELAQGVRVKAVKSTIGDIIPPAGQAAND